jgi:hypothetical protein
MMCILYFLIIAVLSFLFIIGIDHNDEDHGGDVDLFP